MECVASRMRGSVECGPVTAHPLATVSATKRRALLRAIASRSLSLSLSLVRARARSLARFHREPENVGRGPFSPNRLRVAAITIATIPYPT